MLYIYRDSRVVGNDKCFIDMCESWSYVERGESFVPFLAAVATKFDKLGAESREVRSTLPAILRHENERKKSAKTNLG